MLLNLNFPPIPKNLASGIGWLGATGLLLWSVNWLSGYGKLTESVTNLESATSKIERTITGEGGNDGLSQTLARIETIVGGDPNVRDRLIGIEGKLDGIDASVRLTISSETRQISDDLNSRIRELQEDLSEEHGKVAALQELRDIDIKTMDSLRSRITLLERGIVGTRIELAAITRKPKQSSAG